MRKTRFGLPGLVLMALLAACFLLSGCGGQQDDTTAGETTEKTFELNWAGAYPEAHPTTINAFKPWIQAMDEQSNGRLKIHFFAPDTLCPQNDTFDSTVSGFVDIGSAYEGYNPGKFPLTDVINVLLDIPSAEAGALILWDLYNTFPEVASQYEEAKLLWNWTSATYQIHTVNKEVRTLEDLKGLRIIGWDTQRLDLLRHLGANPMEISPLDTYLALERGMADGVMCPLAPVRSYKISDVAKYHTIVDLGVGPFYAVMNLEKWNSLPADLQSLIEETTGAEMARRCGITLDEGAVEDSKWMLDNGHTFYVLPPEEKARWIEATSPLQESWLKSMEAQGFSSAKEILETAKQLAEKYAPITGRGYVQQ